MLNQYFQSLFNTSKLGDAREESYYSDLKQLIENYGKDNNKKIYVTALPKKTEAGNPDFRVWDGRQHIIGYIEAKNPTVENLESIEDTEQLLRYRHTFPNLILTNFFEFRFYRHGELIKKVTIGRPFVIYKLRIVPPIENQKVFLELLEQFFSFSTPRIYTAKQLAIELAKRTRFLRDQVIEEELKEEKIQGIQNLEGFYEAFKDHLISSLTLKDFSNLFSQTITYGLFAARSRAKDGFNRKLAYELIPHTIGILRDVFRFISSTDLPQNMEWIIDDIAEVLSSADVNKIMSDFYQKGKGGDPIIHFYETFLAEYDPKEREKRGVYYTPEPVVSYIVRSIHKLLKEKFGKADGFADSSVTVLDPAAGTLTFPAMAIKQAVEEYKSKYGEGGVHGLIHDHILKNFYAFELMMAPYAIGHLKMGFIFEELNYRLSDKERFNLYLTNTLDFTKADPNQFPGVFEQTIAKESQEALKVKEEIPVMVVMGNPPYSVSSSNVVKEGTDFFKLYESYKEVVRKEERNIQPLSDDYIKFIAFAHWKVKQAGQGIVGMITNNSYLDGLIHRDIRRKLLEDFNEIYVLNLHGNSKRQEKTPEGEKDENVFDIQQGVSIILLIKNNSLEKTIKYCDVWGLREEKYSFLDKHNVLNTSWQKLIPKEPQDFFITKDLSGNEDYEKFVSLKEIFTSTGVKTHRDSFVLADSKEELERKLRIFLNFDFSEDMIISALKLKNTNTWNISQARKELNSSSLDNNLFRHYSYRLFDTRWIYYSNILIDRTRDRSMWDISDKNPALVVTRQLAGLPFKHAFVTIYPPDICLLSLQTKESSYAFPLYRYYESDQQSLLNTQTRSINFQWNNLPTLYQIAQPFTSQLTDNFLQVEEAIFYYIYAVLYSNIYREKYKEFLKIDFPRIPFTQDYHLFQALAQRGEQLVKLHLLKSPSLDYPKVKFYGKGDNRVDRREYKEKIKEVWINELQYFEGIQPEVWNYYIGGYQVLDKWLKDRKDRTLSAEDIKHYCKIVTALSETIEIQKEIDKLYPKVEEKII